MGTPPTHYSVNWTSVVLPSPSLDAPTDSRSLSIRGLGGMARKTENSGAVVAGPVDRQFFWHVRTENDQPIRSRAHVRGVFSYRFSIDSRRATKRLRAVRPSFAGWPRRSGTGGAIEHPARCQPAGLSPRLPSASDHPKVTPNQRGIMTVPTRPRRWGGTGSQTT